MATAQKTKTTKVVKSREDFTPHPIDIHVGHRLRARRKSLHMSQEQLGRSLGITFQQIQKYERGTNRISASMMWLAAQTLQVPTDFFYEGLAGEKFEKTSFSHPSLDFFIAQPGAVEVAESYPKLSKERRRAVVRVCQALVAEENQAEPLG